MAAASRGRPEAARRAGLEGVEKVLTKLTGTDTTARSAGMLRLRTAHCLIDLATVLAPRRPGGSAEWSSAGPLSLQLERVRSGVCAGAGRSSWHRRSSPHPP